jgi:carboxypeptidase T
MKKILLFALIILFSSFCNAQTMPTYSLARIYFDGKNMSDLAVLGIETDHGKLEKDQFFESVFSAIELIQIKNAGFRSEVQIEDMTAFYLKENKNRKPAPVRKKSEQRGDNSPCDLESSLQTPENYTYGSMGGYHTYEEMLAVLDDMHTKFPNLITARAKVSETKVTQEGRPLWYVKLSDNPNSIEIEPQALFTAVHHAREPNSMSHLLFFIWHLLENYETDHEAKVLLDNAQLFFVPCLNPDGYIFNHTNYPDGGGFWRKNRRDNGDGTFGVDLNRNYGYEWGFDDTGSSPNSSSDTYRGLSAFSEPETQMMVDFASTHDFRIAMNNHTYSNVIVHPWGYGNTVPTPDFTTVASWISRDNNYFSGSCYQVLGYFANGGSDDWWYGNNSILAFTPETGSTFWPFSDQIDGLNKNMLTLDMSAAYSVLGGSVATHLQKADLTTTNLALPFKFQQLGLDLQSPTVSLKSLNNNVIQVGVPQIITVIQPFQSFESTIDVTFKSDIAKGDPIELVLTCDAGNRIYRDTLRTVFGVSYEPILLTDGNGSLQPTWTTNQWSLTNATYYSAPASITDSPQQNYTQGQNAMTLTAPILLPSNATTVRLRYQTKWEIEENFDWAQVQLKIDDAPDFKALKGLRTSPGVFTPIFEDPIYTGISEGFYDQKWLSECIDLTDFIGKNITLQFLMQGDDNGQNLDGFYFDDLKLEITLSDEVTTIDLNAANFQLMQNIPNPAKGITRISWDANNLGNNGSELLVLDALGRIIYIEKVDSNRFSTEINVTNWKSGTYFYHLIGEGTKSEFRKMVVIREK